MKLPLLICLLTSSMAFGQQRAQFQTFVPIEFPYKTQMPYMNGLGGLGAGFAYKPKAYLPLFLEIKANFGTYASQSLTQTYSFSNGDVTNVDVSYASYLNKFMIGSKFVMGSDYNAVRFFATPQIGTATMRTTIRVADPEDEDDCRPLEKRTSQRFQGFVYGGEIGMDIALERIFKSIQSENTHRFSLGFQFYRGFTPFEYTNVNHMIDGTIEDHQHDNRDINAKFINITTNSIHEHKIAELYRSNLQMWGLNFGYTFNF